MKRRRGGPPCSPFAASRENKKSQPSLPLKYDPAIHHRRSIRLKGYDYAQTGAYFITICTRHREHFFGQIAENEMIFNDAGGMINEWREKIPGKFPDIQLGPYITMPNHFHAIVISTGSPVRADTGVCPDPELEGEHGGSPLRAVVQWFKTMTTTAYIRGVKEHNWPRFDGKLWHRNYYEHIIRNETAYQRIADYILQNPSNGQKDTFNQ